MTDKPVNDRLTASALRKAAHEDIGRVRCDSSASVTNSINILADRLEEAERAAENCHEAHASLLDELEKAEREVERSHSIVNDAAHEFISRGWSGYAERLRASLREGSK